LVKILMYIGCEICKFLLNMHKFQHFRLLFGILDICERLLELNNFTQRPFDRLGQTYECVIWIGGLAQLDRCVV
jgi:hypothetical protein